MYYIYHIPGIKIGCTTRPKHRVKQQGYSDYEILESYECIDTASKREIELQKEYGYPVDISTYKQSVEKNPHKQHIAGRASATKQWRENRDRELLKCKKAGEVTKRKYSKTILQYDLDGNFIKEWIGVKATARKFNGSPPNLSAALNGNQKTFSGFIWKYKK